MDKTFLVVHDCQIVVFSSLVDCLSLRLISHFNALLKCLKELQNCQKFRIDKMFSIKIPTIYYQSLTRTCTKIMNYFGMWVYHDELQIKMSFSYVFGFWVHLDQRSMSDYAITFHPASLSAGAAVSASSVNFYSKIFSSETA